MAVRLSVSRLLSALPLLVFASMCAFAIIHLTPGDPVAFMLPDTASDQEIATVRHQMGLDLPLPLQYLHWAGSALHGDLGYSFINAQPVARLIGDRLPVTLSLVLVAMVLAVPVAFVLGTLAGAYEGTIVDRAITVYASLGLAMPGFWIGLLLAYFIAVQMRLLPAVGFVAFDKDPIEWLRHLILPAVTLSIGISAELIRQLRSSMADVMRRDYIQTAEAKGLRWPTILGKHAFRNAAIPVFTILGLQLIRALGGAVIVELVFAVPGFGSLVVGAASARDLPVLQGVILVTAVMALGVNFLVDLGYLYLDPRLRTA